MPVTQGIKRSSEQLLALFLNQIYYRDIKQLISLEYYLKTGLFLLKYFLQSRRVNHCFSIKSISFLSPYFLSNQTRIRIKPQIFLSLKREYREYRDYSLNSCLFLLRNCRENNSNNSKKDLSVIPYAPCTEIPISILNLIQKKRPFNLEFQDFKDAPLKAQKSIKTKIILQRYIFKAGTDSQNSLPKMEI